MRTAAIGIVGMIVAVSCATKMKETPGGLKFEVLKAGSGASSEPGKIVVYNLILKDSKDSVWMDSYDRGYPDMIEVRDTSEIKNEDGLMQMMRMLVKGDSVRTTLTVDDLFTNYAKMPIPGGLDPKLEVHYVVSIAEILTQEEFPAYNQKIYEAYQANMQKKQEEHSREQLPKDIEIIDKHLASKGIKATALESGIRYVVTREGEGPKADSGQVAYVDYAGYMLDGTYFDTSNKMIAQETGLYDPMREAQAPYAPYPVTVDIDSVIKGWHLALKEMNKGMKATFWIPSSLAYGSSRRSEVIVENSILVFDLELVDLK